MFSTYILYSKTARRYYVGSTQDFTNRFSEHNLGETKSIRFGIPWTLIWTMEFASRAEAMEMEKRIKGRGIRRFLIDAGVAQPE